jgi:argininosuccinate lyase
MHIIHCITFNDETKRAAHTPDLYATADALRRVREGTPFREAYRQAAAELDRLSSPAPAEALAAYATTGTPGHVDAERLRASLAEVTRRFADAAAG